MTTEVAMGLAYPSVFCSTVQEASDLPGKRLSIVGDSCNMDGSITAQTESTRERMTCSEIPTLMRCINMVCPRTLEDGVLLPGKAMNNGKDIARPAWVIDHLQMALKSELGDKYESKYIDKAKT